MDVNRLMLQAIFHCCSRRLHIPNLPSLRTSDLFVYPHKENVRGIPTNTPIPVLGFFFVFSLSGREGEDAQMVILSNREYLKVQARQHKACSISISLLPPLRLSHGYEYRRNARSLSTLAGIPSSLYSVHVESSSAINAQV